jgi:hypothetical protein
MVVYTCNTCKKFFNDKTKYTQHINRKFKCYPSIEVSNISQESLNNSENKCVICNKEFSKKNNLNKHIKLNRCKNMNLDMLKLLSENLNMKINLSENKNIKSEIVEITKETNKQNKKSEIEITKENNKQNILDDDILIQKIKDKFNSNDMEIFDFNFKIYKKFKNNKNDFIVDFDEVYKFIGIKTISNAKRLLFKEFEENKDFKILFSSREQSDIIKGDKNKENIMLNIKCFKKYCLVTATKQSKILYDYYISMEEIIMEYMEEQFNKQNNIIREKNKIIENNNELLQIKDEEINNIKQLKYEESDKLGSIYILTTDKPNIVKCGRTRCMTKRKNDLQIAQVDDIKVLYEYKTSDDVLLETIVHKILNRYKLNREHFTCDVEYMKSIINIAGSTLDILNSTFEYISKDEILDKIYDKFKQI